MELNPAVLPGDGVGPAATTQELNVSRGVGEKPWYSFKLNEDLIGGVAIDTPGKALNYETLCMVVGHAGAGLERRGISSVPRLDSRGE
jgi:isocitrate/isopropylmalate dehydrogenase